MSGVVSDAVLNVKSLAEMKSMLTATSEAPAYGMANFTLLIMVVQPAAGFCVHLPTALFVIARIDRRKSPVEQHP